VAETLEATFECWTITSTLVRDTKRVRVGQMIGCNGVYVPEVAYDHEPLQRFETEVIPLVAGSARVHSTTG
jgi:hypothetical protein